MPLAVIEIPLRLIGRPFGWLFVLLLLSQIDVHVYRQASAVALRQAIRDVCTSRTGHLPFGWGPSPGELYKVEPPMKRETLASDNRRKLHRIVFRASAQELRVIQSKAAAQRLTVSAYLRGTTDREVATPFVEPCRHDLMMAGRLARVSSGLTYLLRLMERNGGYPNAIEIASNIADLKTVMLELALKLRGRE